MPSAEPAHREWLSIIVVVFLRLPSAPSHFTRLRRQKPSALVDVCIGSCIRPLALRWAEVAVWRPVLSGIGRVTHLAPALA